MAYGYIYKTTNLINGKIYVGQHKGTYDPTYFGSGVILFNSIKKHGISNFKVELLMFCETFEDLNKKETEYIALFRSLLPKDKMYNIQSGGHSGDTFTNNPNIDKIRENLRISHLGKCSKPAGWKHTEETRKKMSVSRRKDFSPMKGKHHSIETREKLRKATLNQKKRTGWKHTNEAKEKNRIAHLGIYDGEKNPFFGKNHTKESIQKAIETRRKNGGFKAWNKGKIGLIKKSLESRKKQSETMKKIWSEKKKVEQYV